MRIDGRVGAVRADLTVRRESPTVVAFGCRNNPEFRLVVDVENVRVIDGFATDGTVSTAAGGHFHVTTYDGKFRVDHPLAMWFWLEFDM